MHAIEEGSEARAVRSEVKSVSDHPIYSPPLVRQITLEECDGK